MKQPAALVFDCFSADNASQLFFRAIKNILYSGIESEWYAHRW